MRITKSLIVAFAALALVGAGCKRSAEDLAHKDACDKWPKFNGEYAVCWSKKQQGCVSFLPTEGGKKFQVVNILDRKVLFESEDTYPDTPAREKAMQKEMAKMSCL